MGMIGSADLLTETRENADDVVLVCIRVGGICRIDIDFSEDRH